MTNLRYDSLKSFRSRESFGSHQSVLPGHTSNGSALDEQFDSIKSVSVDLVLLFPAPKEAFKPQDSALLCNLRPRRAPLLVVVLDRLRRKY